MLRLPEIINGEGEWQMHYGWHCRLSRCYGLGVQLHHQEYKMRKIIVSEMVTVDGFFAGPYGELEWFVQSDELDAYAMDLLESVDTILYGRTTYEMMAGYWPTAPGAFAARTNKLRKLVFSKTLRETPWGEWNTAQPIAGNLSEQVKKLERQPGKAMVIYGSGSVVGQLTNLG
jgi:dihydrofolate reductase